MSIFPTVESKNGWPWSSSIPNNFNPKIKWPKISIITPSYNQGGYIEQTIRSVLLQGYPNLEYIIIDGRSDDQTVEIIRKYEQWITFWISEDDLGQSDAINKGLTYVTGDIFNWINSDDWYEPDSFYKIALSFINNPHKLVVSGFENHIFPDASLRLYEGTILQKKLADTINHLHISQPSTFFRLSVFKNLGTLSLKLNYRMDSQIWLRFLLQYGQDTILKTSDIYVNFRFHEKSKTTLNLENNYLGKNFELELNIIRQNLFAQIRLDSLFSKYFITNEDNEINDSVILDNIKINDKIITRNKLRFYYIKRYINSNFREQSLDNVKKALKDNNIIKYSLMYYVWFYLKFVRFKYLKFAI